MDIQIEISIKLLESFIDIIWRMDFLGTGIYFRPKLRTVAATAGMDFFVVRSWNCLFVKWVKYTPIGVLPSTCRAFKWMEMVMSGMNPKFLCISYVACWSICASLWLSWPFPHQMKCCIFFVSSFLWRAWNRCCLHLEYWQIPWG